MQVASHVLLSSCFPLCMCVSLNACFTMPRNKVNPLLRRRVARACDSCKRRKERCSGATPCGQCVSRQQQNHCQYTTASQTPPASRPLLRETAGNNTNIDNEIHRALDALEDLAAPSDVAKQADLSHLNSAPLPRFLRMLRDSNGKFSKSSPYRLRWNHC